MNPPQHIKTVVEQFVLFRRRHQTLSRAVSKVDGFVKFGNVAGFVCHIANIILLIYSLIFQPESTETAISTAVCLFWLCGNINGLLFSANAGIIVNHVVRKMHYLLYKGISISNR